MLTPAPPAKRAPGDPTLSVVLPNYNHAGLIRRAVEALRAANRLPDEILIIDDASTDQSLRVIEELAAGWSIIRVLANSQNQGAIAALSRGLQECGGKYIYFAAADDWIEPDFFSSAIDALERHPQAGLFCGETALVDGYSGRELGIRPPARPSNRAAFLDGGAVANLLRTTDNWILTGSAVFRRDRVLEAGGFSPELGSFADGYVARKIALRHGFCYAPDDRRDLVRVRGRPVALDRHPSGAGHPRHGAGARPYRGGSGFSALVPGPVRPALALCDLAPGRDGAARQPPGAAAAERAFRRRQNHSRRDQPAGHRAGRAARAARMAVAAVPAGEPACAFKNHVGALLGTATNGRPRPRVPAA